MLLLLLYYNITHSTLAHGQEAELQMHFAINYYYLRNVDPSILNKTSLLGLLHSSVH